MSKNRKRLLRSSLVMLIIAAIALSSATYAWFSAGDTGSVTDIEFTAKTSSGIMISADAVNWKTTLSASEIKTAQTTALVGTMVPVSTTAKVSSGAITLYQAEFEAAGTLKTTKASMATSSAEGYYQFDLYFKNEGSTAKELSLDLTSTVQGVTAAADASKGTSAKNDTGIQNAVRLAFIDQGQGTETTQTVDSVMAAAGGTSSVIWEPNAKTHTSNALTYRYEVGTDGNPTSKLAQKDTVYPYVGIYAEAKTAGSGDSATTGLTVSKGAAIVNADKSKVVVTDATTDKVTLVTEDGTGDTKTQVIATLPGNKVTKVTIYMWIEGQDIDCTNTESGGTVKTALTFKATDKAS